MPATVIVLGLLAVVVPVAHALTALVVLNEIDESHDQSRQLHAALRYQQDADTMHDAIRSDVLRAVLAGVNQNVAVHDQIQSDLRVHTAQFSDDLNRVSVPALNTDVHTATQEMTDYVGDAQRIVPLAFTDPAAARILLPGFDLAYHQLDTTQATLTNEIVDQAGRSDLAVESGEAHGYTVLIAATVVTLGLMVAFLINLVRLSAARTRLLTQLKRSARQGAEANARLTAAQELAHVGSWDLEDGNTQVRGSAELFRIMGLRPESGRFPVEVYRQLVHPDDREQHIEAISEAFAHHATRESSYRFVRPDGGVRSVRSRVTATPNGQETVLSGIVQDVTDQAAAERTKEEFVSVISHELRTPLTSIRGALGLIASGALGPLTPQGQRMADVAVTSSERLARLVNDLLDIERMSAGKLAMNLGSCEARELIDAAVGEMSAMAAEAGVRITMQPVSGVVTADRDRITQALVNLISNAIKFSPPGSDIQVSATRREAVMTFRVADRGRGIPADQLDSVFERFNQVDASDARDKGGSGLGLAICRGIVEQHGGRIWAEQSPGGGTAFQFTLPAEDGADPVAPVPVPATAAPEAAARDAVLICDDDPDVVNVLATMVETHGWTALRAYGGREAIELAHGHHPSVIVLDLIMPGMSGWDVAAELGSDPDTNGIAIVILSALKPKDTPPVDVSERMTTPVEVNECLHALHHALRQPAQPRVLIVDNHAEIADALAGLFERHGIQALTAGTCREAVDISESEVPDLLVLDLGLPDTDGDDLVETLGRNTSYPPLLVYTGTDIADGDRTPLQLGVTRLMANSRTPPEDVERQVISLLRSLTPTHRR